ncbi:HNH endonuclease [Archangium lipolyticum]|uniref:HNH endonuclease n=1 Tax=Archangium lipolyticum TaxID=2970465 RepID=UPI002149BA01|nr:HNH endonuclease [Archangium lipolyticum]
MSSSKRRRILDIVATDATFERTEYRGREIWLGKCLHCNAHLLIGLACARCNQGKGSRHDRHYHRDARVRELVERLLQRRRDRWRDPDDA